MIQKDYNPIYVLNRSHQAPQTARNIDRASLMQSIQQADQTNQSVLSSLKPISQKSLKLRFGQTRMNTTFQAVSNRSNKGRYETTKAEGRIITFKPDGGLRELLGTRRVIKDSIDQEAHLSIQVPSKDPNCSLDTGYLWKRTKKEKPMTQPSFR